jgi:lysozyme
MADFSFAINLIRKHNGFNEKAYADPATGGEPYTIGYGTQFYPDGAPVKKGQLCSKEKALEYLFHEVNVIDTELAKQNLGLDSYMHQAMISFIHSVGWEAFLYSHVIDHIENEDYCSATEEIGRWVFDSEGHVIGSLLERRREEISLFLRELNAAPRSSTEILLAAFRNYAAAANEVKAIRWLEERINPYVLSEFANKFKVGSPVWDEGSFEDLNSVFNS